MIHYTQDHRYNYQAAFFNAVRIGYVDQSVWGIKGRWRWQLLVLNPTTEHSAYWGWAENEDEAKHLLQHSFQHWLTYAKLGPTTNVTKVRKKRARNEHK